MSFYIPIILGSIRRDRQSLKVAKFVHKKMSATPELSTELLDLQKLNLPMMEERLRFRDDSPLSVKEFADHITRAHSLVIVSPEYNHGYPGVLKNALDYLLPEYKRKPFGFVTVSAGGLGGVNCLTQLRLVCLGMGGFPIPESLTVSHVQKNFDENGNPADISYEKRFQIFLDDLLWFTEATVRQKEKGQKEKGRMAI